MDRTLYNQARSICANQKNLADEKAALLKCANDEFMHLGDLSRRQIRNSILLAYDEEIAQLEKEFDEL